MASQAVKDLHQIAKILRDDGYPVSATVCERAADRMNRMEELIISMRQEIAKEEDKLQREQG